MKQKPRVPGPKQTAELIQQSAPKIEFPCANYPIKVIGHNTDDFKQFVIDVMLSYDRGLELAKVTHQDSKNAKFRSVRLFMTAQSESQLIALNDQLKASSRVITVI